MRIRSIPARRNRARAGMVEWNGIFRLFRFSGMLGQPRQVVLKFNFIPENCRSIRFPSRNFRNFWLNGKRPRLPGTAMSNFQVLAQRQFLSPQSLPPPPPPPHWLSPIRSLPCSSRLVSWGEKPRTDKENKA